MNLASILALPRGKDSRSWLPVMTNAELSAVFGQKLDRQVVILRMRARKADNTTLISEISANA